MKPDWLPATRPCASTHGPPDVPGGDGAATSWQRVIQWWFA